MVEQRKIRHLARRVAWSRAGRAVVFPYRVRKVAGVSGRTAWETAKWLVRSREYGNFTYELTDLNVKQLAAFVALAAGISIDTAMGYIDELESDEALRDQLRKDRLADPQWRVSDPEPRYGRRAGWYALLRALQPDYVVETGTDKGLGSMVFAAALLRNGHGRVTTIDVKENSGYLIGGEWEKLIERRIGDSLTILPTLAGVDMFLHDSLHTIEHERREFELIMPALNPGAVLMSDEAHKNDILLEWARRHGNQFHYFREQPKDHWYPGEGIGLSRLSQAQEHR